MDIDIVLDSHLPSEQLTELGLLAEQYGIHTLWNASYLDGRDPFSESRRSRPAVEPHPHRADGAEWIRACIRFGL